jgi:hypothetical protein
VPSASGGICGTGFHPIAAIRQATAKAYLQVYTATFDKRFFFEIVQRKGYRGYGAANAPVRLAAQARLARRRALASFRGDHFLHFFHFCWSRRPGKLRNA